MPNRDGTGPMKQGNMTGRGLGNCIIYGIPALAGAVAGIGFGLGRRRGGGRFFNRNTSSQVELETLKNQAQQIENSLETVKQRISDIESK
jgi:hypothetical protein